MAALESRVYISVDKGTPVLFYRGDFDINTTYVYNHEYRDYVRLWDDSTKEYYYFTVKNRWDEVKGVKPVPGGTNTRWEEAAQLGFLAAGAITADMIDVDSLIVKNVRTAPEGERIEIDSTTNSMNAYDSYNKKVLSVIGRNSETDLVAASSRLILQPTKSVDISQGNNKMYRTDIVTNLLGTQIGLLPKVMISLESNVALFNVQVGLVVTSGVSSKYICRTEARDVPSNKLTAFTMTCDPISLNPQNSTRIEFEIVYSNPSTLGSLSFSCKWAGKYYIDLYNSQDVTEFSADGIVLASGVSYYQMKRENGIVSINSRNTRENRDGYIMSGSYDPENGITFADGDDFSTDEDPMAVGGGSVIISHNLGTTAYTVVATPYSKVSLGSAMATICVVQNKTANSFVVNTYTLPNGARSASPFEFVIYGKRA